MKLLSMSTIIHDKIQKKCQQCMDKIEYKKDYPWPEHSHKAFAKHSDNELITLINNYEILL